MDSLYFPNLPGSDVAYLETNIINKYVRITTDNPFSSVLSTPSYTFNKKSLLNRQDGSQVAARRRQATESSVLSNYKSQGILKKASYQGTNDGYNAQHSVSRVRNGGAAVPLKATGRTTLPMNSFGSIGYPRVNTFFGKRAVAGSATRDAKNSLTY